MGIVVPIDEVEALGARLRTKGQRVVFTNGHFDLLHVGHLRYLQGARALGDVLVVGVNDDAVTTQRKGLGRPILPESERAELLAGLVCVDYVTVFHEPTAERSVALPEAEIVAGYGGETVILPLEKGRSTTSIVEAIRKGRSVR